MTRELRRTLLFGWSLALATFVIAFALVARRAPAAEQRIVRLCDAIASPQSRFEASSAAPSTADPVAVLQRFVFDRGRGGFELVDERARRVDGDASENRDWAPRVLAGADGAPPVLRFPDARGGIAIAVPAQPRRLLAITARVRRSAPTRPITDEAVARSQGVLVVDPVQRAPDLARELAQRDLITLLADPSVRASYDARVSSATAPPDGRWTTLTVALQTPMNTTALVIQIGAGTGVTGAPFDVEEVTVQEMTLRRFAGVGGMHEDPVLAALLPAAPRADLSILPPVAVARPLVRPVEDLLERRDAIVLPPPASASFEADVPVGTAEGDLVLEYGVCRVHETRLTWARARVEIEVEVSRIDGSSKSTQTTVFDAGGPDGWRDRKLVLGAYGGGRLRFRFSARASDGDSHDVVAIGSPLVRRRNAGDSRRNVVLVSLDTVRADHLSCEGYPRPTTPQLDALARESAWFRNAASTSSYTLPAHGSLLSGQAPSRHGAESDATGRSRLWLDRTDLLAARFSEAGWQTAAFTGGVYLSAKFGFSQGFDRYDATDLMLERRAPRYSREPVIGDAAFNRAYRRRRSFGHALDWIRGHADGPFFLFLHTYLVHEYLPAARHESRFHASCASGIDDENQRLLRDRTLSPTARAADVDHFVDLYDAALFQADELIGRLLATLRATGELEQTIVVVVSDHGEEFFEHGALSHGRTLYDEMLRVPLILRVPGAAPAEIRAPVSLVDVAPTLLELTGLAPVHEVDGRSLVPLLAGGVDDGPPQLAELNLDSGNRWIARRHGGFAALDVRDERGEARLARDGTARRPPQRLLYAWRQDPFETVELRGGDVPADAVELLDALSTQRSEMMRARREARRADVDLPPSGYFHSEEEE